MIGSFAQKRALNRGLIYQFNKIDIVLSSCDVKRTSAEPVLQIAHIANRL